MSTQSTYQKDYEDAKAIGAYIMRTLRADGGINAKEATALMCSYSLMVSRACGVNSKQVALDITGEFKRIYPHG